MFTYDEMFKKINYTDHGIYTEYTFEFNFTTKEEYLEQRAGWRAQYKELSKRIRECKGNRKQARRHELGLFEWEVQSKLNTLKEEARMMCQMRVRSKQHANRQMMAQKQAA